jgi:hypothetical protein
VHDACTGKDARRAQGGARYFFCLVLEIEKSESGPRLGHDAGDARCNSYSLMGMILGAHRVSIFICAAGWQCGRAHARPPAFGTLAYSIKAFTVVVPLFAPTCSVTVTGLLTPVSSSPSAPMANPQLFWNEISICVHSVL